MVLLLSLFQVLETVRDLDVDYTQSRLERLSENELRSVKVRACNERERGGGGREYAHQGKADVHQK